MTNPAKRRSPDTALLVALGLVGLIFIVLMAYGCRITPLAYWWPRNGVWGTGLFGTTFGLIGIWGLISIALALWVGVDAQRRGMNGVLWGLLTVFTGIVGLLVYLIVVQTLDTHPSRAAAPPFMASGLRGGENCANCGTAIREDFRVCPQCGAVLRPHCRDCDKPLQPDWKLCPHCGTPR